MSKQKSKLRHIRNQCNFENKDW